MAIYKLNNKEDVTEVPILMQEPIQDQEVDNLLAMWYHKFSHKMEH